MARKKIKPHDNVPSVAPMDKHESMISDMHSALHGLGDQIRPPFPGSKSPLLPSAVQPENPKAAAARAHVAKVHKAFKDLAKKGKK